MGTRAVSPEQPFVDIFTSGSFEMVMEAPPSSSHRARAKSRELVSVWTFFLGVII